MLERLRWEEHGRTTCGAVDGPVRYRIMMRKEKDKWVWVVQMNGVKIGESYKSFEDAVDYIERGRVIDA